MVDKLVVFLLKNCIQIFFVSLSLFLEKLFRSFSMDPLLIAFPTGQGLDYENSNFSEGGKKKAVIAVSFTCNYRFYFPMKI